MHRKPGETGKTSSGENSKNTVESLPQNYRFPSLVVVERVLKINHTKNFSMKKSGPPKTPPLPIMYSEGKVGPKHKEFFAVRGPLEEGLGGGFPAKFFMFMPFFRRRTNVQQLTCNIDLSCSFYYLFFSLVLIELKPFVLKGKVLGENSEKV